LFPLGSKRLFGLSYKKLKCPFLCCKAFSDAEVVVKNSAVSAGDEDVQFGSAKRVPEVTNPVLMFH
jgi:hypothetical protein